MFSFSAIAVIAGLITAQLITSGSGSYVRLETSTKVVEAGELFAIDIYVHADRPVNAVDVTLRFDEDMVEVKQVDRGQSVLTIWTEDPVVDRNTVTLRGGTFRRGFIGEHKLASVDLLARETGQSEFSITDVVLLAGDGAGSPVTLREVTDAKVSLFIYDENTSPESIGVDVKIRIVTDINGDGRVTLSDVSAFMAAWADRSIIYDFNGDNRMTFRDFSIILADLFFGN